MDYELSNMTFRRSLAAVLTVVVTQQLPRM